MAINCDDNQWISNKRAVAIVKKSGRCGVREGVGSIEILYRVSIK